MMVMQIRSVACAPVLPAVPGSVAERLLAGVDRSETWLGIYHRDSKLGFVYSSVARRADSPGFVLHNRTRLRITALGQDAEMEFSARMELDARLRAERFTVDFEGGGQRVRAVGVLAPGGVALTIDTGGELTERFIELDTDRLGLSSSVSPVIAVDRLEPGVEYVHSVFDPVTLTTQHATIELIGREEIEVMGRRVLADKIEVRWQDTPFLSWLGPDGEVLRQETPLGWTLVREAPEVAIQVDEDGGRDLLAEVSVVPTGVAMPADARSVRRLTVRLGGVEPGGLDLHGGPQRIVDGALVIRGLDAQLDAAPADGAEAADGRPGAAGDRVAPEHLRSTPFIASDAPEIIIVAEEIAGDATDPLEIADRLVDWVHGALEKRITMSLPSALEVLRARAGDCNEHTTLFVALARARGVPARIACGLAWHERSFYYHAWPEVWAGQRWVAVDPTFGQRRADAARVRLVTGGLERQLALGPLVGRITVEILEVE